MKTLALITGRSGSKRLPQKNIKNLGNIPLIAWSIRCAKYSEYINKIIVTTDSQEIADLAKSYGAETPFLRPKEFASDDAPEILAIKHALEWLNNFESYTPDLIVLLRPTSPFRKPSTVDAAIRLMKETPYAHSARSVSKCKEHPHKMWKIKDGMLTSFVPERQKQKEAHNLGYQALPEAWIQNASFDVLKPSVIAKYNSTTGKKILPIPMNELESIDINTELDFITASAVLNKIKLIDNYYITEDNTHENCLYHSRSRQDSK